MSTPGKPPAAPTLRPPTKPATVAVPQPPTLMVGERGLELKGFEEMYRFADCMVKAGICPQHDNAATVLAKIQAGMELGFPPIQSVNGFYVVNGRIAMEIDLIKALVARSGKSAWSLACRSWLEGEGEQLKAVAIALRQGETEPERREFSVAQARQAGLLTTKDNWKRFPFDMLLHRAEGRVLKHVYPDVIRGIYSREEAEDITLKPPMQTADAQVVEGPPEIPVSPPPSALDRLTAELQKPEEKPAEKKSEEATLTEQEKGMLKEIEQTFGDCKNLEELHQAAVLLKEVKFSMAAHAAAAELFRARRDQLQA